MPRRKPDYVRRIPEQQDRRQAGAQADLLGSPRRTLAHVEEGMKNNPSYDPRQAQGELSPDEPVGQPQSPRKWDEGEHEGCGIDSQRAFDKFTVIEQCAKIAENFFGGKAHTYSSENADLYRAQDAACKLIAAKIRALAVTRPDRNTGEK